MRRRAETLGGRLQITSAPGRGTRVEFEIPIYEEQVEPKQAASAGRHA